MASRSSDPSYIKGYLSQWAKMPGSDPSLTKDPDYWVRQISGTGGLGSDNVDYWQKKSLLNQGGQGTQQGGLPRADPLNDVLSQLFSNQSGTQANNVQNDPMFAGDMRRVLSAY